MNSMKFTDNILSHKKVYETHFCYLFLVSRGLSILLNRYNHLLIW